MKSDNIRLLDSSRIGIQSFYNVTFLSYIVVIVAFMRKIC